ncbi:MAG: permease prefix domain 1-containing protein [Armatimonadetes bacterium]|nr:permease prefix domain 1-containing protein [Armatimonadota bacterium]
MYNLIEDYLDRLSLPLVRRLPYYERQRIRQELRDHLMERVSELKAQGVSDDEAVALALKQFGSPEWVGTLILEKRTPLPRLNWWRALVLLLVVAIGSFALVLANHRIEDDMRLPQVVDVMLWTAGSKAVLADSSPALREALYNIEALPLHERPLPPLATVRPVEEPSLVPLASMVQRRYSEWFSKVQRDYWNRVYIRATTRGGIADRVDIAREGFGVVTRPVFVPYSVCVSGPGGCASFSQRLPNGVVALQVMGTLMASAAVAGLVMRQRRWVLGVSVAVAVLSLVWCVAVAENFTHVQSRNRDSMLGQIAQSVERSARQQPKILLSSPPRLPLQALGLQDNAQRPQRILQLARLYRFYEADYQRIWQEWRQAGIAGQTWRVFRAYVVPVWWVVPLGVIGAAVGGWLGITVGVWAWRVRSYLVYRYV